MPRIVVTQQLAAVPIEEVFDFVVDQRQMTSWCPKPTACELTAEGDVGAGATRRIARTALGVKLDSEWVCDEFDRPRKVVWRTISGRIPMIDTYEFTSQGDGTDVVHTVELEVRYLFVRLIQPLAILRGRRDMTTDLNNLKTMLEARAAVQA